MPCKIIDQWFIVSFILERMLLYITPKFILNKPHFSPFLNFCLFYAELAIKLSWLSYLTVYYNWDPAYFGLLILNCLILKTLLTRPYSFYKVTFYSISELLALELKWYFFIINLDDPILSSPKYHSPSKVRNQSNLPFCEMLKTF